MWSDNAAKRKLYIKAAIIGEIAAFGRKMEKKNIIKIANNEFKKLYSIDDFVTKNYYYLAREAFVDAFEKECAVKDIMETDTIKYQNALYYVEAVTRTRVKIILLENFLSGKFKSITIKKEKVKKFDTIKELENWLRHSSMNFTKWFKSNKYELLRKYKEHVIKTGEITEFEIFAQKCFEEEK